MATFQKFSLLLTGQIDVPLYNMHQLLANIAKHSHCKFWTTVLKVVDA